MSAVRGWLNSSLSVCVNYCTFISIKDTIIMVSTTAGIMQWLTPQTESDIHWEGADFYSHVAAANADQCACGVLTSEKRALDLQDLPWQVTERSPRASIYCYDFHLTCHFLDCF